MPTERSATCCQLRPAISMVAITGCASPRSTSSARSSGNGVADRCPAVQSRRFGASLADGELAAELTLRLTASEIAATAARVKFLLKHRIHPYPSEDWPAVPWPPV